MTQSSVFHYETTGARTNPALVLLHGFMGSLQDWKEEIIPVLSKDYFCIALDLPGHGKTETERKDEYRMDRCAANITALMDILSVSQAHIVGYSMGGRLALYMAVHFSGRVGRVVIESGSPGLRSEADRRARMEQDGKLKEKIRGMSMERFLEDWYQQPLFATMDKASARYKSMVQRRLRNDPQRLGLSLEYMGTGVQPSLWDKLDKIRSPLLLMTGEHDEKFRQVASEMAGLCPTATLAVVRGAGHCVHFDNPTEYIEQVSLFLKS